MAVVALFFFPDSFGDVAGDVISVYNALSYWLHFYKRPSMLTVDEICIKNKIDFSANSR